MDKTRQIAVAGIVLVGLSAAGYYKWMQDEETQGKSIGKDQGKTNYPEIKGSDDLDKLVVTNADKGEVVLEKKGDKWELTKPVNFPANQANVKTLLDNLKELAIQDLVEPNPTEDIKKSYQLDAGHAVHVVGFKGADKKVDDTFGKSGSRGQTVITGDNPAIYIAKGYSSFLYAREVKAWRDTEVFKFEDGNAISLTIDKAADDKPAGDAGAAAAKKTAGTFSFTKGDKWAGTWNGQPIARFDEEKVKDVLRVFHALNADDFGDGKGTDVTGLDKPQSTVTITLKDNAGKYVLKVGKQATGSARYATKDGSETVYVIGSAAADWATADVSKFEHPADAGAGKDSGK